MIYLAAASFTLLAAVVSPQLSSQQSRTFAQVYNDMPAGQRHNLAYALYEGAFILYDRTAPLAGKPVRFHVLGSCHLSYAPENASPLQNELAGCSNNSGLELLVGAAYGKNNLTTPWNMGLAPDPMPHPRYVMQALHAGELSAAEKRVALQVLNASSPADQSTLMYVMYRDTLLLFYGHASELADWKHCTVSYAVIGSGNTGYFPCPTGGPGFYKDIHTFSVPGEARSALDRLADDAYDKAHLPALWTRPFGYFF